MIILHNSIFLLSDATLAKMDKKKVFLHKLLFGQLFTAKNWQGCILKL